MPVGGQRQFQLKKEQFINIKLHIFFYALLEFPNDAGGGTEAVPAKIEQFINVNLNIFFFTHS